MRSRGRRVSVPLTGCATDEEASVRAYTLVRLVRELDDAGAGSRIALLCKPVGAATTDGELDAAVSEVHKVAAVAAVHGVPQDGDMTVREFGRRWTSGDLHREHPDYVRDVDHTDNRGRLEKHVYPHIGDVPLRKLRLEDGERVLRELRAPPESGLRRHVAQCLARLVRLAVFPAKILTASPLPVGFLPRVGAPKAAPFLYPKEEAKLLACTRIPLVRRVVYGLLTREGLRVSELLGRARDDRAPLPWTALDLASGTIALDDTKTGRPRVWALSPGTVRALERWRKLSTGKNVCELGVRHGLARRLRADIRLAGVNRVELGVRTAHRAWLKLHHLRATFVTLSLANGRSETWVQDRTGHTSSVMINRYRRAARMAEELALGELLPLDEAIPELRK